MNGDPRRWMLLAAGAILIGLGAAIAILLPDLVHTVAPAAPAGTNPAWVALATSSTFDHRMWLRLLVAGSGTILGIMLMVFAMSPRFSLLPQAPSVRSVLRPPREQGGQEAL
jgi:uncharacterized membrane protein